MSAEKVRGVPGAYLAATTVVILVNMVLTVVKELFAPLKNWLAATFGHHWTGHGVVLLITWVILVAIFYAAFKKRNPDYYKLTLGILGSTVLSILVIVAFYTMHYLKMI